MGRSSDFFGRGGGQVMPGGVVEELEERAVQIAG